MIETVVVVPCYNEENRLQQEAYLLLASRQPNTIFLFVNDGSQDKTQKILETLHSRSENCVFLNLLQNVGKAEAVRQGILYAISQYNDIQSVSFYDADMATPYEDMQLMIQQLINKSRLMVVGCRFRHLGGYVERKFSRFLMGRLFATMAANILKLPVYDTQCGAKVFSVEAAQHIFKESFISKWLFDVELFARLIDIYGYDKVLKNTQEYPLTAWYDVAGSKLNIKSILRQPLNLMKINCHYKTILKQKYADYLKTI